MLKVDYTVNVYVGGNVDIPEINLVSGVCSWDNESGILDNKWWSTLASSVDISYSGNYEVHSPTTIKIIKVALVETTLKNNGLSLVGKRIEIVESTIHGDRILKRGIIGELPVTGNTVEISVSHVTNKYNSNLTSRFGDEYGYLVYGDNVSNIPLSIDETNAVTTTGVVGNNYYPAFIAFSNGNDNIVARSVYPTDVVSNDDMREFISRSNNFILSGTNELTASSSEVYVFTVTIDGIDYSAVVFLLIPMNRKDENGEWYLPYGSTIVVRFTDYAKVYTPQGIIPSPDNVTYENNGVQLPFPSYIDSLFYYDDRIEILDSDDSGLSFVNPSRCRLATVDEIQSLNGGIFGGDDGYAVTFSNSSYNTMSSTITNADNIAYRGEGDRCVIEGYYENKSIGESLTRPVFMVAYEIQNPDNYENLYITGDISLSAFESYPSYPAVSYFRPIKNITVSMWVRTILGDAVVITESVNISNIDSFPTPDPIHSYIFPPTAGVSTSNVNFRITNDGRFLHLGNDIDLLSFVTLQEVEIKNPITVFYSVSFPHATTNDDEIFWWRHTVEIAMNVHTKVDYSLSDLKVQNASNSDGITDIATAYIDVCSKQNLTTLGVSTPSKGWGLELPTDDISVAVNTVDILAKAPYTQLTYSSNSTGTKNTKYNLLKYGFGIGYIDDGGLENWADISKMYDAGGVAIAPFNVVGEPSVRSYDGNKVFCDIGVKSSSGNITVKNTEQDVFNSDYVTGIVGDDAKLLWFAGNLLYNKFQVKNEYNTNLSDCTNIVDAVGYISNQYILQGAVGGIVNGSPVVMLYDRYTISFTVSTEFAISSGLWIGSNISFTFPHIANGDTGIITGMIRNIDSEVVSITAEMVGDVISSNEENVIIESGDREDNIIESGDRETNYVETV